MHRNAWTVLAVTTMLPVLGACTDHGEPERITAAPAFSAAAAGGLDAELRSQLAQLGFTGRIGETLEARLGRRIDHQLADIGRMLWFDPIGGLNDDNTCGGCHSPTNGFGDTQSIAIGIDNNGIVGPGRTGPRNQRRSPMVINAVFYPTLMWNSRFNARSVTRSITVPVSSFPTRKGCHCRTSRTCSRRRRSSRRPSASRSPVSPFRAVTMTFETRSCVVSTAPRTTANCSRARSPT